MKTFWIICFVAVTVKLKDIAEKTGYSITTVSRALAGYSDVNEHTRQRILEVAAGLGYQPNLVARQLRSQRTQTLGMIIPHLDRHSFTNDFFTQLMLGAGDAAAPARYALLVSAQVPGEEEMAAYRHMVGGHRVDGIIVARTRQSDPRISYLRSLGTPFVVSGRGAPGEQSDFPYIDVDSQAGLRMVVEHFVALGHRHIGLILPPPDIAYTGYRLTGYCEGLAAAGIAFRPEYVVYGDLLRTGGYHGAERLLSEQPQITAIAASNDLMALGVLACIRARGLRVGIDVAVAGFDDIPAAEYANPPLTTVHQPIYEIGQRLAGMLIGLIQGQPPAESQLVLTPALVIRESSGSVAA